MCQEASFGSACNRGAELSGRNGVGVFMAAFDEYRSSRSAGRSYRPSRSRAMQEPIVAANRFSDIEIVAANRLTGSGIVAAKRLSRACGNRTSCGMAPVESAFEFQSLSLTSTESLRAASKALENLSCMIPFSVLLLERNSGLIRSPVALLLPAPTTAYGDSSVVVIADSGSDTEDSQARGGPASRRGQQSARICYVAGKQQKSRPTGRPFNRKFAGEIRPDGRPAWPSDDKPRNLHRRNRASSSPKWPARGRRLQPGHLLHQNRSSTRANLDR